MFGRSPICLKNVVKSQNDKKGFTPRSKSLYCVGSQAYDGHVGLRPGSGYFAASALIAACAAARRAIGTRNGEHET